jgi:hypothetical protein
VNPPPTFWTRVWFGPHEPGWFNFFDTAARRFAIFWPAVLIFSITGSAFMSLCVLGCWMLSGHWAEKWQTVRSNPVALASLGMGLLALVGCLYGTASQSDMLRSLKNASNFFIIVMCITLFDKAAYRDMAIDIFHLAAPVLLCIKIFLIVKFGNDSRMAQVEILDYVVLGIIVITWILLILYRPFSWKPPWLAKKTMSASELSADSSVTEASSFYLKMKSVVDARIILVLLLILFLLVTNNGRTVYLCLSAVLAVIFARNFRWKDIAKASAIFLTLLLIITACFPLVRKRCMLAYQEAVEFQADNSSVFTGKESSVGRRLFMYKYGLKIASMHPIFGAGTGSIAAEYDKQLVSFNRKDDSTWQGRIIDSHCEYLSMLIQFGIVGLIGYVGWLAVLWYYSSIIVWPWNLLGRCMVTMIAISTLFSSHMSNARTGCFYALMLAIFFSVETRSKEKEIKKI